MKHHFADFLDRGEDYWTIVPNRDRYSYQIDNIVNNNLETKIVTISKSDEKWREVFNFSNLEELTLHEPSKEQIHEISKLTQITRLRVTHLRTKDLNFIKSLINIEELVLEYVSGFSDLSPLKHLKSLKSLHLENLRKVSDFSGLSDIESLKYLYIDGTLDWNQPIHDFEFLYNLKNLEVLELIWFINKSDYPATKPILSLKNLKRIKIIPNRLNVKEFALLEQGLNGVQGAVWEPFSSIMYSSGDPSTEWYEFLGKKAGRVKASNPQCKQKCEDYKNYYESLKTEAKALI